VLGIFAVLAGAAPAAAHGRWEQAFSLDDGQTWETNWTADFTRCE